MEKLTFLRITAVLIFFAVSIPANGEITYREKENVLWVEEYPEEKPATMAALLSFDKKHKRDKVSYDKSSDTYTICADLWIGNDTGLSSFLQIGSRDHPAETVRINGSIWIQPPKKSIIRTDGRRAIINRLTLGDPNDPTINAKLKINFFIF